MLFTDITKISECLLDFNMKHDLHIEGASGIIHGIANKSLPIGLAHETKWRQNHSTVSILRLKQHSWLSLVWFFKKSDQWERQMCQYQCVQNHFRLLNCLWKVIRQLSPSCFLSVKPLTMAQLMQERQTLEWLTVKPPINAGNRHCLIQSQCNLEVLLSGCWRFVKVHNYSDIQN